MMSVVIILFGRRLEFVGNLESSINLVRYTTQPVYTNPRRKATETLVRNISFLGKFVSPEKAHNSPNSSTAPSLTLCVSVSVGMAIYLKRYIKFSKKAGERKTHLSCSFKQKLKKIRFILDNRNNSA